MAFTTAVVVLSAAMQFYLPEKITRGGLSYFEDTNALRGWGAKPEDLIGLATARGQLETLLCSLGPQARQFCLELGFSWQDAVEKASSLHGEGLDAFLTNLYENFKGLYGDSFEMESPKKS